MPSEKLRGTKPWTCFQTHHLPEIVGSLLETYCLLDVGTCFWKVYQSRQSEWRLDSLLFLALLQKNQRAFCHYHAALVWLLSSFVSPLRASKAIVPDHLPLRLLQCFRPSSVHSFGYHQGRLWPIAQKQHETLLRAMDKEAGLGESSEDTLEVGRKAHMVNQRAAVHEDSSRKVTRNVLDAVPVDSYDSVGTSSQQKHLRVPQLLSEEAWIEQMDCWKFVESQIATELAAAMGPSWRRWPQLYSWPYSKAPPLWEYGEDSVPSPSNMGSCWTSRLST